MERVIEGAVREHGGEHGVATRKHYSAAQKAQQAGGLK